MVAMVVRVFIRHDRCVYRNRCHRMKAAFAGSVKSSANTEFPARATITVAAAKVVAVVVVVVVLVAAEVTVVDPVLRPSRVMRPPQLRFRMRDDSWRARRRRWCWYWWMR